MEFRTIGSLDVSVVGVGCNNFGGRIDADATARVVGAALDAGINLFDTADVYGGTLSEELLGQALGSRRDEAIVATKFGSKLDDERGGASAAYVRRAVDDSLKRLGTDVIDLYQLHRPDPETDIAETLAALDECVRAGKVREIGCSNFSVEQLAEAEAAVRDGAARFVSLQNEYSLLEREPETGTLQACERTGVAFMPFYPLHSGLLTGKYRKGAEIPEGTRLAAGGRNAERFLGDEKLDVVEELIAFAEARGHTILELAVSWLLARPVVATVIAGATRPEQIEANVQAAGWTLSDEELAAVDEIVAPPAI